jgi:hypothetical protein
VGEDRDTKRQEDQRGASNSLARLDFQVVATSEERETHLVGRAVLLRYSTVSTRSLDVVTKLLNGPVLEKQSGELLRQAE